MEKPRPRKMTLANQRLAPRFPRPICRIDLRSPDGERARVRGAFALRICTSPRPSPHPVAGRPVHQDAERKRAGRRQFNVKYSGPEYSTP